MSKINDMRIMGKNQLNLIKIFEKIFPDKKTKYYELLSRFVEGHFDMVLKRNRNISRLENFDTSDLNDLEKVFLLFFMAKIMSLEEIEQFKYFCEKHDENAIKADLQKLEYSEISSLCDEAKSNDELKKLQNQNIKLYEDNEWLVLIPLTYECSVKYGYGTKWCTASEDTDQHFSNYTGDGVLIYIINRKTNVKTAIYQEKSNKSESESNITLWDAEDNCIEIFFTDIPQNVLSPIREFLLKNNETNSDMFDRIYDSEDEETESEDEEDEEDNEDYDDLGDSADEEDEEEDDRSNRMTNEEILMKEFDRIRSSKSGYSSYNPYYKSPFMDAFKRINKF